MKSVALAVEESPRAATANYYDVPVLPELERVLRDSWPYDVDAVTVVDGGAPT